MTACHRSDSNARASGRRGGRSTRPLRRVPPATERLEARVLLSAVAWTGGGDGATWTDPLNWSTGVVPGAADDVTIDVPGNITVQITGGAQMVQSLTTSDTLSISAGSLVTSAPSQIANLVLAGGTLDGTGDVTVTNTLTWDAGTMTGTGKTILPASATLSLQTTSDKTLQRELDN